MNELFSIATLRKEMGLSQEEFGARIGLKGKSSVSELEKQGRASVDVALAIEALSVVDGVARIDAARLNEDVAKSRAACVAVCHAPECQGADAAASAGDADISHHDGQSAPAAAALSTGQNGILSRQGVAA